MKAMWIHIVAFNAVIALVSAQQQCDANTVEKFCKPEDDEAAIKTFPAECHEKIRAAWVTLKPQHKEACDGKSNIEKLLKTCTTMYKMYNEFLAQIGAGCIPKQ